MKKPEVTKELIEYLEKTFPLEAPKLDDSLRVIYFKAGRRDIVTHLKAIAEKKENELCAHQ